MIKLMSWLNTQSVESFKDMKYNPLRSITPIKQQESIIHDIIEPYRKEELSFDDIIDVLEINELGTVSKRYGRRIKFKEIRDKYIDIFQDEDHTFYNMLREYYHESKERCFVAKNNGKDEWYL